MLFEHFPYTNMHNFNLTWLLESIEDLKNYITTEINNVKKSITDLNKKLEQEIAERKTSDVQIWATVDNNNIAVNARITVLENKHDNDILKIYNEMYNLNNNMKNYVDIEIQKVIDMIKTQPTPNVFNYLRQKTTSLQCVLRDYYATMRDFGFTAGWFDAQGATCEELDGLNLTAYNYDFYGLIAIKEYQQTWPWLVYNQYDGSKIPVAFALNQLFNYHLGGITCQEWDNMDYTCEEFDAAEFTAYKLDWTADPKVLDNN